MKKFLIMGMAAMGLALTACNNDETVEVAKGNAIGFNTFVNNSTRATDMITARGRVKTPNINNKKLVVRSCVDVQRVFVFLQKRAL